MNPLRALLRKDLPWLLFFLVGGMVGLVLALWQWSFVQTFVVSPGRREALFHVAWSCGMGLGVVAFAFDEALGTREFLAQRPVPAGAVMRARFVGCALVLAVWMLLAPLTAYVLLVLDDGHWEWGHWRQLPSIWGTMLPALSACALGALATSLPFAWWARLAWLGAMFVLSFSAIFWCERAAGMGRTSWPVFVAGHLVVAVAAAALAWRVRTTTRDGDQPLAPPVLRTAVVPMLVVGAVAAAVGLNLLAVNAVKTLRSTYPRVLRDGPVHLLGVRPDWRGPWLVVDADHVPTGRFLDGARDLAREGSHLSDDFVRIEAPRAGMADSAYVAEGTVLVDADGTPWWAPRDGRLHRLVKSAEEARFAAFSRVEALVVGPQDDRVVVVLEPAGVAAWRFDAITARFVRLPLAAGDRVVGRDRHDAQETRSREFVAGFVPGQREDMVLGEKSVYALRDGGLVRVADAAAKSGDATHEVVRQQVTEVDGLGWTLIVEAAAGGTAFQHRFTPRTGPEQLWAGMACLMSAIRPPLLQFVAACGPATDTEPGRLMRWQWLLDPLVVAGRRWWLVGACVALAALLARSMRRRLRALGADAPTIRFWTVAIALLGVFGAWACVLCERPRRWAVRVPAIPAIAPRIATPPSLEENLA